MSNVARSTVADGLIEVMVEMSPDPGGIVFSAASNYVRDGMDIPIDSIWSHGFEFAYFKFRLDFIAGDTASVLETH